MNKLILISYLPDFLFWIMCNLYRNNKKRDILFLRKDIIGYCNGWAIGHFISYFIKGMIFQEKYFFIFFLIGFSFEILEYLIEKKTNIPYVDSSIINDPIINSMGYICGIITTIVIKKYKIKSFFNFLNIHML